MNQWLFWTLCVFGLATAFYGIWLMAEAIDIVKRQRDKDNDEGENQ